MNQEFHHITKVKGELNLPGDKSISHRAIMLSAMAKGESVIHHCLDSADIKSTINCFRKLGCHIVEENDLVKVRGKGCKEFKKPDDKLDAGNSGTTARLLSGILAAQYFESVICGDTSLSKRPMQRIVEPLTQMGSKVKASPDGTLPLHFSPSSGIHAIEYKLPVASAQVKSAIIFAALHVDETTIIFEPVPTRNHSEVMLNLPVEKSSSGNTISVSRRYYPDSREYFVPADISTAAYFIVLCLLLKNSGITLRNVGYNKTRCGIIEILKDMGGQIEIENERTIAGESIADLIISSSKLKNISLDKNLVPNIIDEIPALSIAGIFAEGEFQVHGAKELRIKESDRINSLCSNFHSAGLSVNEYEDGFILGGEFKNNDVAFESYNDHRIAMSFALLSLLNNKGGNVNDFDCVKISNPDFLSQLHSITI